MNLFRLICLTVCTLLVSREVQAQRSVLDSLLALEKTYTKGDSVRVKLLTDIARKHYTNNPRKGVGFADEAVKLAGSLGEEKLLASALSARGNCYLYIPEYTSALDNYQQALSINERIGNRSGAGNNYNNIGAVYYNNYEYPKALEYYLKTLQIYEQTNNQPGVTNVLSNIGNIYNELRDFPAAIDYYQRALVLSKKTGNRNSEAGILINLGNVFTQTNELPKALAYKKEALEINKKVGNKSMIANNLINIGNVYTSMEDYPQALQTHHESLRISESIGDRKNIAYNLVGISSVYVKQGKYAEAREYGLEATQVAGEIALLSVESDAWNNLSKSYEALQLYDSAFIAYQAFVGLRDSINFSEKQKEITRKTLQYEFGKKEALLKQQQLETDLQLKQQILLATRQQQEIQLQQTAVQLANKEKELQHLAFLKSQTDLQIEQSSRIAKEEQLMVAEKEKDLQATQVNLQQTQLELKDKAIKAQKNQQFFYLASLVLLSLLAFFAYRNFRNQQKLNKIIQVEKKKSDDLLLNILPANVADELRNTGKAAARQFDAVTVLFTDFVDFTRVSERLTPEQLVSELHECFMAFDRIIERHGLEKIKTIGDAYMAVSGLPETNSNHAVQAAQAALDIRQWMSERQSKANFETRIGLHSGPVVAGIVGVKKFAYDIWGDTVNTAARMESSSEPGKINISEATFAQVHRHFTCTPRGKIKAKNKGEVEMYFLEHQG